MSIPLDRLYNFLHDSSDHDIIIYRYLPHGSKNIVDLKPLQIPTPRSSVTQIHMWCHDQEPFTAETISTKFSRSVHNLLSCRESFYNRCLLAHSEQNSAEIKKVSHLVEPVYYWSHALIAHDWFRYARHDPTLKCKNILNTFLIYNRAWSGTREYRMCFADQIIDNHLVKHCLTTFNPQDNGLHWQQHQFINNRFRPKHNLEQLCLNVHHSWASADYTSHDYQHTLIEVVLETLFDDTRHHLTEKTLRPIACGQPFILARTPGALKYLQSYGFVGFDPYIDESYDCIQDPLDRISAITAEMKRIASHDRRDYLSKELLARARFNQDRFFSDSFLHDVIGEYRHNLNHAIKSVTSSLDTQFIKMHLKHAKWTGRFSRQDAKEIWLRYHKLPKNW
jgi:hypothetical protein